MSHSTVKGSSVCAKIDRCSKIKSLFDHDWAGDWQLADAMIDACSKCENWKEKR